MQGFLNPNQVLDQLGLREEMLAAEFGCGSGGFAIPLAKRLREGRVYAIDIQQEALAALKGKAAAEKVRNIEPIHSDLEKEGGSTLPSNFLDRVLIANLLFQVAKRKKVLAEAGRVLKSGGKVIVIDWRPEVRLGPQGERVSAREVKEMAAELGLKLEKEFAAGDYHYGLVLAKSRG